VPTTTTPRHEQDPRRGIHEYKGPSNRTWKFLRVVYACHHSSFVKEFQKVFTKDKGPGALEVHAPVRHIQSFKVAGIVDCMAFSRRLYASA
jgi:hypothetical protein